jgi:hypothetical protein
MRRESGLTLVTVKVLAPRKQNFHVYTYRKRGKALRLDNYQNTNRKP